MNQDKDGDEYEDGDEHEDEREYEDGRVEREFMAGDCAV